MTSLNPLMKVGRQVEETIRIHEKVTRAEARERTEAMFTQVGISDAAQRMECYPHQLSGGLRQRVMIAMAMILKPKLLIADEPTTALDVTVEAQILRLMRSLCDSGTSILLISHNLGVIAQVCDYVYVMYAGRVVEQADTCTLFDHPAHPYTRALLGAASSLRSGAARLETIPGGVPNLLHLPSGCSFSPRCEKCARQCQNEVPQMLPVSGEGHLARCYIRECPGGMRENA
jgi:oligopeptide/dipeptide ABC transporter ATP-binding protein